MRKTRNTNDPKRQKKSEIKRNSLYVSWGSTQHICVSCLRIEFVWPIHSTLDFNKVRLAGMIGLCYWGKKQEPHLLERNQLRHTFKINDLKPMSKNRFQKCKLDFKKRDKYIKFIMGSGLSMEIRKPLHQQSFLDWVKALSLGPGLRPVTSFLTESSI